MAFKLIDIDLYSFEKKNPLDLKQKLWYYLSIYGNAALKGAFFFIDLWVMIFLFPVYGYGDMNYGRSLESEYSIPYGYQRYIFIIGIGLHLLVKLVIDFGLFGWMKTSESVSLSAILSTPSTKLCHELLSMQRWSFFRWLQHDLSFREKVTLWTVQTFKGWKRFLFIKTPLFLAILLTLQSCLSENYKSKVPAIRDMALFYLLYKTIFYWLESFQRMLAIFFYLAYISPSNSKRGISFNQFLNATIDSQACQYLFDKPRVTNPETYIVHSVQQDADEDFEFNPLSTPKQREEFEELYLHSPLIASPKNNIQKLQSQRYFDGARSPRRNLSSISSILNHKASKE